MTGARKVLEMNEIACSIIITSPYKTNIWNVFEKEQTQYDMYTDECTICKVLTDSAYLAG